MSRSEPDNPRTLTAVIDTSAQRAESALGVTLLGRARSRLVIGPQHGSGVPGAPVPPVIAAIGEKMPFLIRSLAKGGARIVITRTRDRSEQAAPYFAVCDCRCG